MPRLCPTKHQRSIALRLPKDSTLSGRLCCPVVREDDLPPCCKDLSNYDAARRQDPV